MSFTLSFSFSFRGIALIVFALVAPYTSANKLSLSELSQSKQWQKLLHYKEHDNNTSYITSKNFLLSSTINRSPLDELKATINAFMLPVKDDSQINKHAQCRFPARLMLIKKHLNLKTIHSIPKVKCENYQYWLKTTGASSISVVFASGYMSNPASMYGHLFIKLNRDHNSTTKHKTSELLNASLNYGAIVPNKENPVMYVLKGIFGNYDAGYSDQQFYRHQHNYGNVELRDLWDYKLSLTQEDVDLIVAHIWELLGNKFDYYFIDENCAFHIAKLLEIVLPNPLISNNSLWVLPSDVAKGIVQASYNASMLLEKVDYIPSSESILRDYYQQLTVTQQNIAQALVALNFDFTNKNYQQLAVQDKKIIVESLFQYINVMKQKQPDNKQLEKNKKKLIKERYQMPIGKIISVQPTQSKSPPHQGMETSKYSLGYASVKQNQFLTAGFRMTYFDNLSMNLAKQPFANLEMIDIELIATDDEIRISKVDLIDIDSLYIPAIPWANGSESAWSVRAGYEQVNNQCFDCGIYFAEGDIGKSTLYQDNHLLYAMLGGKIFFGSEDDINLSAKMGIISQFSDRFKLKLAVQKITDSNFSKASQTIWSGEINYQIAPDWELRFLVNKQYSTKIELKVNYFWGF